MHKLKILRTYLTELQFVLAADCCVLVITHNRYASI